jgi:hypothetical protein
MVIEGISDHPDDEQFRAALAKRQCPGPKIFFIQHLHKRP